MPRRGLLRGLALSSCDASCAAFCVHSFVCAVPVLVHAGQTACCSGAHTPFVWCCVCNGPVQVRALVDELYTYGIYTIADAHQDVLTESMCGEGMLLAITAAAAACDRNCCWLYCPLSLLLCTLLLLRVRVQMGGRTLQLVWQMVSY